MCTSNNRGATRIHPWPLLFIIFMNDAPDAIKQILDLYADDTTLQTSDPDLLVLEQTLMKIWSP